MSSGGGLEEGAAFELLAGLTARLASTARLDEVVDTVLNEIVDLGFGAVWMAVLDEQTGHLLTVKEVIDGVDTTREMPSIFMLDMRQPIGHGFRERRMINIVDPDSLHILEREDEEVPPGRLALPRVIYEHMRGHPFACGPLLGSRGQPVGALGLSSYHGKEPIPDELFSRGLLRAFMDHLGIAMERALHLTRLERLNADLVKAQAAIESGARLKAVGELATAVAHDLNNLSGIALLAVSTGLRSPAAAHEVLPRIERANRAIGELVGRLQRVARSAATTESRETARLPEILDDLLAMVSPLVRERAVVLERDLHLVSPVRADPVIVHQVVLNLILNALEALDEVAPEERRLRLSLTTDGLAVRLTVTDSGPGISAEVLPALFQPFVTSKRGHHVGLGLAAAHASLKHFGGSVEGHNLPGGGAAFEVTLAVAPPEAAVDPVHEQPAAPAMIARHGSILALDDDEDVGFMVRAYLEPFGYQVRATTNTDDALEEAGRAFDLILCDVGMPKRSGLEVCHALRQAGYRGKLVLMTGWDSQLVNADRRAQECDKILSKPFLGPDLLQVVDSLLA